MDPDPSPRDVSADGMREATERKKEEEKERMIRINYKADSQSEYVNNSSSLISQRGA
jgi:hypothetical protein